MLNAVNPVDVPVATLIRNDKADEAMRVQGRFHVECRDADGNLKFIEDFDNLVFNAGKADMLDKYLAGSAYTAAWYLGLVDGGSTPTYNAADTSSSHAGWTENTGYSNATRPAPSWNSASSSGGGAGSAGTGTKGTTSTAFNINATGTIAGIFLTTVNTKGGTTGVTFSAGSFGTARTVASGDTLSVTYTLNN